MNQTINIQDIKKILPGKYAKRLAKRIWEKHEVTYNPHYIYQVLSNPNPKLESLIVREAILWAEEILLSNKELLKKANSLKPVES